MTLNIEIKARTPEEERAYNQGKRRVYLEVLNVCLRELNPDERLQASWLIERHGAIRQLRELCETWGDNDWPDSLDLADIIEKHLARYLDEDD